MAKILMIDDEVETLEIYKTYLEDGNAVFPYSTGADALRDVQEIRPDVILLDIEMPYMDGFKVLEFLRSSKDLAQIPVIGVTGQRSKTTALKFLGKGAAAYVLKPVSKDELRKKVEEVFQQEQDKKTKKKILVVDDEVESLLYFKNILSNKYNVMALNSGKAALDYLLKAVPDLIILDYQMPLFNGRQIFQIIRTMEKLQSTPIVFLTSMTEKEILLECAELKPDAVILKNSGKDVLLDRINEILLRNEAEL